MSTFLQGGSRNGKNPFVMCVPGSENGGEGSELSEYPSKNGIYNYINPGDEAKSKIVVRLNFGKNNPDMYCRYYPQDGNQTVGTAKGVNGRSECKRQCEHSNKDKLGKDRTGRCTKEWAEKCGCNDKNGNASESIVKLENPEQPSKVQKTEAVNKIWKWRVILHHPIAK